MTVLKEDLTLYQVLINRTFDLHSTNFIRKQHNFCLNYLKKDQILLARKEKKSHPKHFKSITANSDKKAMFW